MHQLSSTKRKLLPPMLSWLPGRLPAPSPPFPAAFRPTPVHFQGILLKPEKQATTHYANFNLHLVMSPVMSHIGLEEHMCAKTGFFFPPCVFLLVLYFFPPNSKGALSHFLCEALSHPCSKQIYRSSTLRLCLVPRPLLPAPPWVEISLVFLPISSTRHEHLKGSDLRSTSPLLPSASDPMPGTRKAGRHDWWNCTGSAQSPRRLPPPSRKVGINSDFPRVSLQNINYKTLPRTDLIHFNFFICALSEIRKLRPKEVWRLSQII